MAKSQQYEVELTYSVTVHVPAQAQSPEEAEDAAIEQAEYRFIEEFGPDAEFTLDQINSHRTTEED